MIFGIQLAQDMNIDYMGFDCKINTLKYGITKEQEREIIEKQEEIINSYSWKEFNKVGLNSKLLDISRGIIDQAKWTQRENIMRNNIIKIINSKENSTKIVVLTGTGHIPFFQREFPNADFPLI